MNSRRILAILKQEYYITRRSVEIIFDILFMPVMSIVVFGFLSSYLASSGNPQAAGGVLMGMILWQVLFIVQYSVAVGSLWNIWSRNLSTMFVSPLQVKEYILAHTLSGVVKGLMILTLSSAICYFLFDFNILQLGFFNLILFLGNFMLFAVAVGMMILGAIFRFGTKIQALAWGLLSILQPLTAAFYPVSVLPSPIREFSYIFPATHIFEAARLAYATGATNWNALFIAFGLNIVYLIIGMKVFKSMFYASRMSGQFARNEG